MNREVENRASSVRLASGGRARDVLLSEAFTLSLQRAEEELKNALSERRCNDSVKASLRGAFESGALLGVRPGVRSNAAAFQSSKARGASRAPSNKRL